MRIKFGKDPDDSRRQHNALCWEIIKWWESYKKNPWETNWSCEQIESHLAKWRELYQKDYNRWISIARTSKDAPSLNVLYYFFYDDLLRRLKQSFKMPAHALPVNWPDNVNNSNFKILRDVTGRASSELFFDLHSVLDYIHERKPCGLAIELSEYISRIDQSLHENWHEQFGFQKTAILLVLHHWQQEYKSATESLYQQPIEVGMMTLELPLDFKKHVTARIFLHKKQPTLWKAATVTIVATGKNTKSILLSAPNPDKGNADVGKYSEIIPSWESGERIVEFGIGKRIPIYPKSLSFGVQLKAEYDQPLSLTTNTLEIKIIPKPRFASTVIGTAPDDWCKKKIVRMCKARARMRFVFIISGVSVGNANLIVEDLKQLDPNLIVLNPSLSSVVFTSGYKHIVVCDHQPEQDRLLAKWLKSSLNKNRLKKSDLILLEHFATLDEAMAREQQIKGKAKRAYIALFSLEAFLNSSFPGVLFDENARNLLKNDLAAVLNRSPLEIVCRDLTKLLRNREIAYIDINDVKPILQSLIESHVFLNALEPRDSVNHDWLPMSTEEKKTLWALSHALSSDDDKPPDESRTVPVSSIVAKYPGELPQNPSIVTILDDLCKRGWCQNIQGCYKFPTSAHWRVARKLLK